MEKCSYEYFSLYELSSFTALEGLVPAQLVLSSELTMTTFCRQPKKSQFKAKFQSIFVKKKNKEQGQNFFNRIKQRGQKSSVKLSNRVLKVGTLKGTIKYCVPYKTY